jgi:hypothetical protein
MKGEMSDKTPLSSGIHRSHYALVGVLIALMPSLSHAGTWVAFQNSYTRGTGAPVTVTDTFTLLNPATQYTLKAFNGGLQNDTTELVANSVVFLNGVQVVGPANFNQSVSEVSVVIFPGLTNTLSVQVRGKAGGVLAIQVIGVDNDPPTISATVSPSSNAAGWNNSPVTVTFTCSDKTSGVASCPSPVTVSTEGANQVISGTATDLAGNTATTSVTINLDMTPPTITGSINPPPDAGGYNSSAVTVTFSCSDALSGVASCSSPVAVITEGAGQAVSGTATDIAGNSATTTISVNISFNNFKIQSWQTGPNGNAKSPSGKCLDYGPPQPDTGATVFLNDCSSAHSIRVAEIGDQTDVQGFVRHHDVVLFAGPLVIGIHNPPANTLGGPPPAPSAQSEYPLELQTYNPILATTLNQIFALDGDSIILESSRPCINTVATVPPFCPDPPPQLVIQVQNARGANGSALVAAVRNLADNEFWDFVPLGGSRPYPTIGFKVSTQDTLANDVSQAVWGSVLMISSPTDCSVSDPLASGPPQNIGGCIKLHDAPALVLNPGVTIRGTRRGTSFGPQLYAEYDTTGSGACDNTCMFDVVGDYARVTGLRVRGQTRSTNKLPETLRHNDGILINYAGTTSPCLPLPGNTTTPPCLPQIPFFPLATITQLIATVDHNDMSDWSDAAVSTLSPFFNASNHSSKCGYTGYSTYSTNTDPADLYTCDNNFRFAPNVPYSPYLNLNPVPIAEDPIAGSGTGTLSNVRVARNFLHNNEADEGGYGVGVQGRALVDGNTFDWNRHDITANAEPHYEYRASHNLVLSGAYEGYLAGLFGRLQDFDMHGTDWASDLLSALSGLFLGGAGGYYVDIDRNTFLGGDGLDYRLRGYPVVNSLYQGNVSRRNKKAAVQFVHCYNPVFQLTGCANDYTAGDFPITITNDNVFSDSSPAPPDPTSTLGVGDFDGDGDDDLFLATGAAWYYSPAGKREWRYLNSAPDTIDQLLFGDFDGDGRTDVVGMRNGKLYVSWGGISAFDPLNATVPANCTMADMAVGDFDGDGHPDIFCADYRNNNWWISYGGNTQFVVVNHSGIQRKDLRFGDFDHDGTTDVFSVQNTGWYISRSATGSWADGFLQPPVPLISTADALVVADFNGDGFADVGMLCGSSAGWQISSGGTQGWSTCNTFVLPSLGNLSNCASSSSPCITLANGAVGRFNGGPGSDILLWYYTNSQGAASLLDVPSGTGAPYQLASQDMH